MARFVASRTSVEGARLSIFELLRKIDSRPKPFEFYTAAELWTDDHTSQQMLAYHLDDEVDLSSRNAAFINRSVAWIVEHFGIGPGTRIADFGCGPGLYTAKLARTGAEVTGIDFSKRSIEYAREVAAREGLSVNYINQNYLNFDIDSRFDLITMIMCDFCALSPSQRGTMLRKFNKALNPGGRLLLDVYSLVAFKQRQEEVKFEKNLLNGFWSPNPYYGFLNTFKYDDEKVVLDKYTIVETDRVRTVYNWLQYFSHDALEKEFAECGFTIQETFADVAGSPFDPTGNEFAVVAGKS
jgi:2-polyprenyl-3-methyl-5-hydroxy-6-metoxy-1,4-benzoquinol methylase